MKTESGNLAKENSALNWNEPEIFPLHIIRIPEKSSNCLKNKLQMNESHIKQNHT